MAATHQNVPKQIKAYDIDFNWGPGGPNGFARPGLWADADPAKHVAWYKALGANVIQTFCVSCNGYAWYKGGVIPEQPGLKHDFLPEMVRLGHREGMLVLGYFCAGSNTKWGQDHPDLSYGFPSEPHIPYTDEYLAYLDTAIRDAVGKTGIDGFMIDWLRMPTTRAGNGGRWLECEKKLYDQLMGEPFPGEQQLAPAKMNEYGRRAVERCWKTIRKAAKETNPRCIVWLTCCDIHDPHIVDSPALRETDWLLNEAGDLKRTADAKKMIGPQTRLITCLANWNRQDPMKIVPEALKDGIGLYGFTKPGTDSLPPLESLLTRPVNELQGDERNIAVLARAFRGASMDSIGTPDGRFVEPLSTTACAPEETTFILAREGRSAATILLARQPTRAAQFAAYELQWHLRAITGGEFPIICEDDVFQGAAILLGDSRRVRALGIDAERMLPQEYLIQIDPQTLVLVGRDKADRSAVEYDPTPNQQALDPWPGLWDERGTLDALYDFLERYCGVRWFNPTEFGTSCPRQRDLAVSVGTIRRQPFMKYRYACYPPSESYDQYTGLWTAGSEGQKRWEAAAYPKLHQRFEADGYTVAKRGFNTLFRLRRREGGEQCPGNHSLYGYYRRFWAPEAGQEALFEAHHADWFAQGYEGQPPQMCYTSRGLIEQVAKDAREFFDTGKTYPGGQAAGRFFCVEPMDNSQFCKCASCQKWFTGRDDDSPFFTNGRYSDYFFQFVNEVARLVGRTHPDKRIVCLAYMTHGAPPETFRLEPNVLVQYCFACNRLNYDRPSYEHEVALLERWRQEYPDYALYLWLYDTFPVERAFYEKFHCFPGFFARAIGEQFDLFRRNGYRGVFHCGYGQEVEAYLTYQLMDDPTRNVETLLDEYFKGMYGPAAPPMRAFYELVEQTYGNPANYPEAIAQRRIEAHHHQTEEIAWGYLGTAERMERLGRLMEEAKAAASTEEQKQRVALFELGTWDYMKAGRKQYEDRLRPE